jgi:hypothetical protein
VHDCIKKTWEETVEAFETIRKLTTSDVAVFQLIVMEAVELYAQDGEHICVYVCIVCYV